MLAELTTLRLGGPARRLIEANTEMELVEAVRDQDDSGELFVLGGGSNLVVADVGFAGTVVKVGTRGVREVEADDSKAVLTVAAGEPFDRFVAESIERGLAGLETLSGIPGTVGAAPIQNIGAYGRSVEDCLREVEVLDRDTGRVSTIAAADCRFGYRDSRFKRERDRYVVLNVVFELEREPRSRPVSHRELAAELEIEVGERASVRAVREAVLKVRARKGMVLDAADHDTWSAGSFFVNPVLGAEAYAALRERARARVGVEPPAYPDQDGTSKVPAAWLIERAGFEKGYPLAQRPDAGIAISTKHPLALTNRGHGTSVELVALARGIVSGVEDSFGVRLAPEPRMLGFDGDPLSMS